MTNQMPSFKVGDVLAHKAQQKERERKMFGMTIVEMHAVRESQQIFDDIQLWIMCLLSDAQHAIEFGNNEQARQWINQAKYWVGQTRPEAQSDKR